MLHAPLVLVPGGVAVQVVVDAADDAGSRAVSIFSRPEGDAADVDTARRGCARDRGAACRLGADDVAAARRAARRRWTMPTR